MSTPVEEGITLKAAILTALAGFAGVVGVVLLGVVLSAMRGPQPCLTEDQTTACVWDAQHQGNGQGRSFEVHDDGSVTYR